MESLNLDHGPSKMSQIMTMDHGCGPWSKSYRLDHDHGPNHAFFEPWSHEFTAVSGLSCYHATVLLSCKLDIDGIHSKNEIEK